MVGIYRPVYANCSIYLVAGQSITLGTCGVGGSACIGDTILGLYYPNSSLAAYNDDYCGLCSSLNLSITVSGQYILAEGCYSSASVCTGTVAYTITSPSPPPPSPPPSPPTPPPSPPSQSPPSPPPSPASAQSQTPAPPPPWPACVYDSRTTVSVIYDAVSNVHCYSCQRDCETTTANSCDSYGTRCQLSIGGYCSATGDSAYAWMCPLTLPPGSYMPPQPPPSPPVYTLVANLTIGGLSAAMFNNATVKGAVQGALASALSLPVWAVTVTQVADASGAANSGATGRRLRVANSAVVLTVSFVLVGPSQNQAVASALGTPSTATTMLATINAALTSVGLPAASSVALPPAPSPPPPSPPPPPGYSYQPTPYSTDYPYRSPMPSGPKSNSGAVAVGVVVPVGVVTGFVVFILRFRAARRARAQQQRSAAIPPTMPTAPSSAVQMSPVVLQPVMQPVLPAGYSTTEQKQVPVVVGVPYIAVNNKSEGVATMSSTSLSGWLEANALPLSVMDALSKAGVATVDDLKYLGDDDIAALEFTVVVKNKLLQAMMRLKGGSGGKQEVRGELEEDSEGPAAV